MKNIFSNIIRNDTEYRRYAEPIFPFLERSSLPLAECVRNLLEDWFSDYPEEEQKHLLPNLMSVDDHVLCSAFFELYLFELLRKLEMDISIHPKVNNEINKRPDFFVKEVTGSFYLEAVGVEELHDDEINRQTMLNFAFDKINEIQSKNFFAHIEIEGNPIRPLPSNQIKNEIKKWFESLDYHDLLFCYQSNGITDMPQMIFRYEGVTLRVSPIPKKYINGEKGHIIGSQMFKFRKVNTKEAIRKALKRKSSRYGTFEMPYIVAINVNSTSCDHEDVLDALFGTSEYLFDLNHLDANPKFQRAKDGFWSKNIRTRVSGALIFRSLIPWTIANCNPTLYLNPWAKVPYHGNLKLLSCAQIKDDGGVEWTEGVHPRDLFSLKEGWPE